MSIEKPPARLLTARDVAARLNIDRRRVYELPIPRIELSPRCYRWEEADVDAYIASRRVATH